MVVAIMALVVAASGTAVAATKLVNGNKLIAKHSLSGNRLQNKTITGTQVNLKKLGTVPNATNAKSATTATTATTATNALNAKNATNATNATNAAIAANAATAANATNVNTVRTWYATASVGQTVPLLTVGPFSITGACGGTSASPTAQTQATTTQMNSVLDSYAQSNVDPFNPGTTAPIGYEAQGTPPDWIGPNDGSDAMLSGDTHTYLNTFTGEGTGLASNGANCTFVGYAEVTAH